MCGENRRGVSRETRTSGVAAGHHRGLVRRGDIEDASERVEDVTCVECELSDEERAKWDKATQAEEAGKLDDAKRARQLDGAPRRVAE